MTSAITGQVQVIRALDNLERRAHGAARHGVSATTRSAQLRLRGQVNAIFSRNRKAGNAVRSAVYDNGERGVSGVIWSRFGRRAAGQYVDFLGPYISGRDITPRHGRYLAIAFQRRRGGKNNAKPSQVRGLEPAVVDGRLYLVRRQGKKVTFFFELVQRVKVTKRLDVKGARRTARLELVKNTLRGWRTRKDGGVDRRTVRR